jgi:hypothetical protein
LNPKHHEAQLEDQKVMKSSKKSSRRRKNCNANKSMKSGKPSRMTKKNQEKLKIKKLPLNQTPLTLSMQALPLR